ncbi:MAG: hypothetical protein HQ538_04375 [Parcubacteria group bacterium]|nr:hypothetical protein [Parcubacteria group bacterium]
MNRKTKIFYLISFLGVAVLLSGCTSFFEEKETTTTDEVEEVEEETEITVDKVSYDAGQDIVVTYDIVEDLDENSWIGIIPSATVHNSEDEADAVDTDYEYLEGSKSGTKTLSAPLTAGSYDARIYSSDQTDAEELGYVSFVVVSVDNNKVTLELDEEEYSAGDAITVTYSGASNLSNRAWLGVIPSTVEHGSEDVNDANDVSYAYIEGGTDGTATLYAPSDAGSYDIRLNESDDSSAKELAYVAFTVVE